MKSRPGHRRLTDHVERNVATSYIGHNGLAATRSELRATRTKYIVEENNDVRRQIGVLHHRWNSVQHIQQALAPSAWSVSAVFIERDERTDGRRFHSIAVLSRRVLRSEKNKP